MLEFFSGSSSAVNSKTAVSESVELATGEAIVPDCSVLVIYSTVGHNFQQLLDQATTCCPNASIVGCSGSGVISSEGVNESMRALGVMVIKGDEVCVVGKSGLDSSNGYDLARECALEVQQTGDAVNMIHLLTSGIPVAGNQVIDGIESVFGKDIMIFGGCSADNGKAKTTFQFIDGEVVENGIILVGFSDPSLEVLPAVHHGSVPVGEEFVVTKSDGNLILELDNRPAWHVLMERLGLPNTSTAGETLPMTGLGIELPEDLQGEYDNTHELRVPLSVENNNTAFRLPTEVEEGTRVVLMKRDEDLIFSGLDRLLERLQEKMQGRKPVAVFHVDCMARGRFMFNKVLKDEIIAKMQHPICGDEMAPWLGVYGYSEYCPVGGQNRFHSYTTSLFPIVRRLDA